MELAFMSFSMLREAFSKKMDADKLCAIAKNNGIRYLDLLDVEVRLYGEKKLKAALIEQKQKERQYAEANRKLERIRLAV